MKLIVVIFLCFSLSIYTQSSYTVGNLEELDKIKSIDSIKHLTFYGIKKEQMNKVLFSKYSNLQSCYFEFSKIGSNFFPRPYPKNIMHLGIFNCKVKNSEIEEFLREGNITELILIDIKNRLRKTYNWSVKELKIISLHNVTSNALNIQFNLDSLEVLSFEEVSGKLDNSKLEKYKFKNLSSFSICNSNLSKFALSINSGFYSEKIKYLTLKSNKLTDFLVEDAPETLKHLDLSGNRLTEFPSDVFKLKELEFLSIFGNPIINIPDDISRLSNLKTLVVPMNYDVEKIDWLRSILPNCKIINDLRVLNSQIPNFMR